MLDHIERKTKHTRRRFSKRYASKAMQTDRQQAPAGQGVGTLQLGGGDSMFVSSSFVRVSTTITTTTTTTTNTPTTITNATTTTTTNTTTTTAY